MKTVVLLPFMAVIIAATLAAPGRAPNGDNVRDCLGEGGCLLNVKLELITTRVSVTVLEWSVEHLLTMNNEERTCLESLSHEEVTALYSSLDNRAKNLIKQAFRDLFEHESNSIGVGEDLAEPVASSRGWLEEIVFGGSAEDYCSENERAAKDRQGAQILTGIACAFRAIFARDDEPIVIATNDDNDWKFECMMLGYGC